MSHMTRVSQDIPLKATEARCLLKQIRMPSSILMSSSKRRVCHLHQFCTNHAHTFTTHTLPKQCTCYHTPHHSFMGASKKDYGQGIVQPVLNKTMSTFQSFRASISLMTSDEISDDSRWPDMHVKAAFFRRFRSRRTCVGVSMCVCARGCDRK